MKEVVVCVQDIVGKNKLLVKFEYGQKRYISASFLLYLFSKEEVGEEVDETIFEPTKRLQGEFLTINGYPVGEEYGMITKVMFLYTFFLFLIWDT